MGREIRHVPPNWDHPVDDRGNFKPMFDDTFEHASAEWKQEFCDWESGKRPEYYNESEDGKPEFWEWHGGPPDREYYRPWKDEEATWFQLWETVSEGSPVSPPFATKEELITYLADNGDFWDQGRDGRGGWGRISAEAFGRHESASSFMIINN